MADAPSVIEPRRGNNSVMASCRNEGRMVALRQLLLVIHYRNHGSVMAIYGQSNEDQEFFAILIAASGLVLTGIIVAIAVHAGTVALKATCR